MMSLPVVSVIIPTRNRASSLARAIDSVRRQTFVHWELIIVDDDSTDSTPELLADVAAADSRIRFERHAMRAGAAAARNRGAKCARGSCLAFLDDDAEWLPEMLERQVRVLESMADAGLVYCQLMVQREDGRIDVIGAGSAASPKPRRALLQGNTIDTSCVILRRPLFLEAGGFDESLPRLQDWDLWLRLAALTRFCYLPEPLVRGYFTPGSISTDADALVSACSQLSAKLEAQADMRRVDLGDWYYALGHMLMVGGAPQAGRQRLLRAVKLKPWPPQRLVAVAAAVAGRRPYHLLTRLRRLAARP